jgi:hypothetical protein
VVVALGAPAIAILAVGGLRFVRDLLDMRSMIAQLPEDADRIQAAVQAFSRLQDEFERQRNDLLTEMSMARESMQRTVPEAPTTPAESEGQRVLERFDGLHEYAQRLLFGAMHRHNSEVSDDQQKLSMRADKRGYEQIVDKLRDSGKFRGSAEENRQVAEWIKRVFEFERTHRGPARGNITPQHVDDLERGRPQKKAGTA